MLAGPLNCIVAHPYTILGGSCWDPPYNAACFMAATSVLIVMCGHPMFTIDDEFVPALLPYLS